MEPNTKPSQSADDSDDEDGASFSFEAGLTKIGGRVRLGKLDRYGVIVLAIIGAVVLGIMVGFVVVKVWGK